MLKVINTPDAVLTPAAQADIAPDQILIEGLVLKANIGVFEHEYEAPQNVRFDVTVDLAPLSGDAEYDLNNIVRYDHIVADIKTHLAAGHIDLVETLAEDVAKIALDYARADSATVTVVKLEAFEEAAGVGVRITRRA